MTGFSICDRRIQIVGEIKNTWCGHKKAEFKAVVEVGRRLLPAKKKLPHGEWGPWLECEFQWTQKTAENYMNLALNSAKIETVTNLDLGAAYVLFAKSTPANIQEELLARVKSGEHISRKDVKERIAAAKTTGRKPTAKPKRAEAETISEPATTQAETPPATNRSPEEDMADAVLTALCSAERNRSLCKLDDVALLLWKDKRIPTNIKECVDCVLEVLAELAARMPLGSDIEDELELAS
jgi:hypothetical protein